MEDAYEGTDEVIGVGVGAEIAAGDGALDGSYESGVDARTGAFHEPQGAACDCVHDGNDEHFSCNVVDEEKHPRSQRFKRWHGSSEALFGCCKLFDLAAVDGFDEVIASGEVAIQGGVADARSACDVVEARSCSIARENLFGYLKDALTVALRVGAGSSGGLRCRELLFRHVNRRQKFSATGDCLRLSMYPGTVSVLTGGDCRCQLARSSRLASTTTGG